MNLRIPDVPHLSDAIAPLRDIHNDVQLIYENLIHGLLST